MAVPKARSPLGAAPPAMAFTEAAMQDALARSAAHFAAPARRVAVAEVAALAADAGARAVVMPWAPVGWTAGALAPLRGMLAARGIALHVVRRDWDSLCWPHATRGFFAFRAHIPALCGALVRSPAAA